MKQPWRIEMLEDAKSIFLAERYSDLFTNYGVQKDGLPPTLPWPKANLPPPPTKTGPKHRASFSSLPSPSC